MASGDLLQAKTKVLETWVDGRRYEVEAVPAVDVRGTWNVEVTKPDGAKEMLALEIKGSPTKLSGKIKRGDKSTSLVNPALADWHCTASFKGEPLGLEGVLQLSATIAQAAAATADAPPQLSWLGSIVWPAGEKTQTQAKREKPAATSDADESADAKEDKSDKKAGDKPDGESENLTPKKPTRPSPRMRRNQRTRRMRTSPTPKTKTQKRKTLRSRRREEGKG